MIKTPLAIPGEWVFSSTVTGEVISEIDKSWFPASQRAAIRLECSRDEIRLMSSPFLDEIDHGKNQSC